MEMRCIRISVLRVSCIHSAADKEDAQMHINISSMFTPMRVNILAHSRTFSGVLETQFIRVSLPRRWATSPLEMRSFIRISKGDAAHLLGRDTRMNRVSSTPENVREC